MLSELTISTALKTKPFILINVIVESIFWGKIPSNIIYNKFKRVIYHNVSGQLLKDEKILKINSSNVNILQYMIF